MSTEDPQARFRLIDSPPLLPGADWLTRVIEGPFIDTGVDVKWNERGRIYLSVDTVRELALAAGLFNEQEKTVLVHVKEQEWYNRGRADAIKEQIGERFGELVDSLSNARDVLSGDPSDIGDDVVVAEGSTPPTGEGEAGDSDPDAGAAGESVEEPVTDPFVRPKRARRAPRQSNDAGGDKRPDSVPTSAGGEVLSI